MMTPVTETYIQRGQVQRAIFLWASKRWRRARLRGGKPVAELIQRDALVLQHDLSVLVDVDHFLFRRRGQRAARFDLWQLELDPSLGLDEFRAYHEEDDQQKEHVDHRRQV